VPAASRPAVRRSRPSSAPKDTPAPARSSGADVRSGSPDDAVSDDDENIPTSSSDGRAVVERVLGGQFLGELES
jgi:hypothetical protein